MKNLIFVMILSICLGCIGGYYWLTASAFDIIYPPGAPHIASDFHSDMGINGGQREKEHQGIDLTGRFGQPIIAAADGIVLETTVEKCWGPTIAVDHGKYSDGKKIIALYGHLGKISVVTGKKIKRGEIIGRLGNNQHKFGCIGGVRHLHFQIGRQYRSNDEKGNYWGYMYFLKDGHKSVNPHLLWSDGPGKITCFKPKTTFKRGALTYPMPCH